MPEDGCPGEGPHTHIILGPAEKRAPQRGEAGPQGTSRPEGWTSKSDRNRLKTRVLPQHSQLCQNLRTAPQPRLVKRGISHLPVKLELGAD